MSTRTQIIKRNNPNKLYILFAEDGSIMSLQNNNVIKQNGITLGVFNAGDILDLPVSEGDVIESKFSIVGGGEVGSSHFSYMPEYMKGKILQTTILRSNPTEIKIYPLENGSVDILVDGVLKTTLTLTAGTVATFTDNDNGAWRLNSTGYIIAQVRSGTSDPHPFVWGNDTKVGFASNSVRVSTLIEEANTTGFLYGNTNTVAFTENGIGSVNLVHAGTRNYEHPNSASHLVSLGKRSFAHSYADSDGSASSLWLPSTLMAHTHGVPHDTEFISFINRTGREIRKYQGGTLIATLTPTKTNTDNRAWFSVRDGLPNGAINITEGTIYVCDEKMYAVYQNRESTIYASLDDETTLLPTQIDYKYQP